jgi:hypothetical protein
MAVADERQLLENSRPRRWGAFEVREASAERWSVRRAELDQLVASTEDLRAAVSTYVAASERVASCDDARRHINAYRENVAEQLYWESLRRALPTRLIGALREEEIVHHFGELVVEFDSQLAAAISAVDRWRMVPKASEEIEQRVGRMAEVAQQLNASSRQLMEGALDDLRGLLERLAATAAQLPKGGIAPPIEEHLSSDATASAEGESEAENVVRRTPDLATEQSRSENRPPAPLRFFQKNASAL